MANAIMNGWKAVQLGATLGSYSAGPIDFSADTIRVALLTNSHSNDVDNDNFWSDVSANEASGTGYTANGAALASKSITKDNTNDRGVLDAADVTWSSSTITARYAAVYKDTGTASTSVLIAIFDFGSDKSSSNGNFTLQWNANGILAIG